MVFIESKHSNNINSYKKLRKVPYIIIITKRELNIKMPTRVQIGTIKSS